MAKAQWLAFGFFPTFLGVGFAQNIQISQPLQGAGVPVVPVAAFGNLNPTQGPNAVPSLISPRNGSFAAPAVTPRVQAKAVSVSNQAALPQSFVAPSVLPQSAVTPALAAPIEEGRKQVKSAEQTAGKPVIARLAAELPFKAPKESGDLQGQRDFAEKSFSFKLGEGAALAGPSASKAPAEEDPPPGDDGGGPDYPSRTFTFRGKTFKSVLFRPNIPVEQDLVRMIDAAQKSIHIAVYEFKLAGVLEALRKARGRGVQVHIVLDYSNVFPHAEPGADYTPKRSQEIWALLREEFDVKVLRGLGPYGINHNKFAVIDYDEKGKGPMMAEFGSFNWSWAAENSHYENANFTDEKAKIETLKKAWDWLDSLGQKVTYQSRAGDYTWPKTVAAPPFEIAETVAFNGISLPATMISPNGTPGKSVEDNVVAAIKATKKTIDIAMFALQSTRIAETLRDAVKRGVAVRAVIDEGQAASVPFGPFTQYLAANGITVKTLAGPDPNSSYPLAQKMHHKFSIFDGKLVETGSANYTKYSSLGNFENAHFLVDAKDAGAYAFVFDHMWSVAKAFPAPTTAPTLPTDAELIAEIGKDAPTPAPPGPSDWPAPKSQARTIEFNGKTFDSYILRPDKPVMPKLVEAIDAAKKSLRLALYEFDLEDVLEALRRAKKRGVEIALVIDHSHVYTSGKDHNNEPRMPSSQIQALVNEGFDVKVLRGQKGGIQHNKYAVFDNGMVVFGSFNWARTAEHNHFENIVFSNNKADIADYISYFDYMRGIAADVDKKKLGEVLARSSTQAQAEELETEADAADRTSKFPPPPESTAPQADLNGEKFHRHLFSPQGQILDAWMRAISAAKSSIEVAMFGFYTEAVAEAIVAAQKKNPKLRVRLVLDSGQSKLAKIGGVPVADWFTGKGVDVKMLAGPNREGDPGYDPMFEKQHNKFMLIDDKFLITGSFNQSPRAENFNFENDNILTDPTDVAGYVDYFERMYMKGWAPKPKVALKPRKPASGGV